MPDAITSAREIMNADLMRMRSISQNLANVNTPGYKRELVTSALLDTVSGQLSGARSASPTIQMTRDMQPGALSATGSDFDLAIESGGFFEVKSGDRLFYTKQGQLQLDEQSRLTLTTGEVLQGESGDIVLEPKPFRILDDGTIEQGGVAVGRMKAVAFEQEALLEYFGSGLFVANGDAIPTPTDAAKFRQGFVETSNVDVTQEMINMINTTRHFETGSRIMQAYDQLLDTTINTLADF